MATKTFAWPNTCLCTAYSTLSGRFCHANSLAATIWPVCCSFFCYIELTVLVLNLLLLSCGTTLHRLHCLPTCLDAAAVSQCLSPMTRPLASRPFALQPTECAAAGDMPAPSPRPKWQPPQLSQLVTRLGERRSSSGLEHERSGESPRQSGDLASLAVAAAGPAVSPPQQVNASCLADESHSMCRKLPEA